MHKAIVVVDMQNDFIDGALGTPEAQEMLPRLVAKLTGEQGTAFIFTMDTHGADYLATQEGQKLHVEHCIRGTVGWQIAEPLQPFVRRNRVRWPVHRHLRHLQRPHREGVSSRETHQRRCLLLCGRHPREPQERSRRDADVSGGGALSEIFEGTFARSFYLCAIVPSVLFQNLCYNRLKILI